MSPSYLTQVFFHGVTIPNRLFPLDTASKAEYLEFCVLGNIIFALFYLS